MKLPRPLDPVEARVLGCLLEKELTTPEYYPLTVNALVAACNQKSNRDPVMDLEPADVEKALDRLHEDVFTWPVEGARAIRWRHNLDRRWELDPAAKAILTQLLLRGPQTPGELRSRSARTASFADTGEVEAVLRHLAEGEEPMTVQLARRPGQKEARWTHLACGQPADDEISEPEPRAATGGPTLGERVAELERRVAELEERLGGGS